MRQTHQNTNYLYFLIDPKTKKYRYIGITNSPKGRLRAHIQHVINGVDKNRHKVAWMKSLFIDNLEPEILVACKGTRDFVCEWEVKLIAWFKKLGHPLTNLSDGGDDPPSWEGKNHTEETKQKASKSIKAYYKNNQHPSKGTKLSSEHIAKIQATRKRNGTKSDATAMLQKRDSNPNWRLNLSKSSNSKGINNPMYGKQQSKESKRKNQLSNLMNDAYKKGKHLLLSELQGEYKEISGHYRDKYIRDWDNCWIIG